MGTAGDDYLRHLLGDNEPLTATAASDRGTKATTEIDDAESQRRDNEHQRVFEARFGIWDTPTQQATATVHSTGSGGYQFDAETLKSKITQWEQLLDDLRKDGTRLARSVEALRPPSPDQPATNQVTATAHSLNAAIEHNYTMQQYAQTYIDALQKANGTYVQHDQDVSGSLYSDAPDTGDLYR